MFELIHFGILDIVLVVLSVLFAIGGFKNGFFKEVFGVFSFFGAVALAYFLAPLVREVIVNQTTFDITIYEFLLDSVFSGNALYDTIIDGSLPNALEVLTDGLQQIGLPALLAGPLASTLITFDGTLGAALSNASANLILTILAYLVTFLVAWILLFIMGKQFIRLSKQNPIFKLLDSLLGLALGVGRAALFFGIAFSIGIALSLVIPAINDFLLSDLSLDTEKFSIAKTIYTFILGFFETIL